MKIIQSFWTKPTFKNNKINSTDRNKGGWLSKKHNYMSWALSCLQLRKFYEKVELVTDEKGYDILINKLKLPYTNVSVVLDELNHYHPDLWAVGKLHAYRIQTEPFIHIDSDIYIYKPFPLSLEKASLIVQNFEKGFFFYDKVFNELKEAFDYVPQALHDSIEKNNKIISVNAGLFGGNDIAFFQEYTQSAFEFIDKNIPHLEKIDIGMFNTVYEQFLFNALAEKSNKIISPFISDINPSFDGIANFTQVPNTVSFIHTVGFYKGLPTINEILEHRLLTDFPEYYYEIINLLRTKQL